MNLVSSQGPELFKMNVFCIVCICMKCQISPLEDATSSKYVTWQHAGEEGLVPLNWGMAHRFKMWCESKHIFKWLVSSLLSHTFYITSLHPFKNLHTVHWWKGHPNKFQHSEARLPRLLFVTPPGYTTLVCYCKVFNRMDTHRCHWLQLMYTDRIVVWNVTHENVFFFTRWLQKYKILLQAVL